MLKSIYLYVSSGLFRFIISLGTFYMILRSLNTFEYAQYGLIVSMSAMFTLMLIANTDSAFQRLYSRRKLFKEINGSLVLLYIGLGLAFVVIILIMKYIMSTFFADSKIAFVFNNNYIALFFLLQTLNSTVVSLVNSIKRYSDFVYLTIGPNLMIFLGLMSGSVASLSNLILVMCVSHGLTLLLYIIFNIVSILKIKISFKKSSFLIRYIFSYCKYSILTFSSHNLLDLTLKTLLMERFGYISLASYNLASSLLSIFRNIDQNIMRAITPYFLESRIDQKQITRIAIIAMRFQLGIIIVILSTAIFWYDFLSFVFPKKEAMMFDVKYLLYSGSVILISYYKNYIIMFLKQSSKIISKLFIQTFFFNLLCTILVFLFGVTVDLLLIFVTICSVLNCYFAHILKNKYFGLPK